MLSSIRSAAIGADVSEGNGSKMLGRVRDFARLIALGAGIWLALGAAGAAAQTIPGEQDYKNNCAVCHGPTGKGDGEAVYVLPGLKPPNLTQLSKNNGGHFPAQQVYQAIDGRDNIAAHHLGDRRMPTWGVNFQMGEGQPNPTSEANTRKRIQDLVSYIQTLQAK
jgi:mono/diheme cytochrome c family protein